VNSLCTGECQQWQTHCAANPKDEKWQERKQKVKNGEAEEVHEAVASAYHATGQKEISETEAAVDIVDDVEGVFAEYQPDLREGLGVPHPDTVVETVSLSYVDAPPITHEASSLTFHLFPRPQAGFLTDGSCSLSAV
jgi:hypothetical protein